MKIWVTEKFIAQIRKYNYKKLYIDLITIYNAIKSYKILNSIARLKIVYPYSLNNKINLKNKLRIYRYKSGNYRIIFSISYDKELQTHNIIFLYLGKRDNIYKEIINKKFVFAKIKEIVLDDIIDIKKEKEDINESLSDNEYNFKLFELPERYLKKNNYKNKLERFFEDGYLEYLKLHTNQLKILNKNIPIKFIDGKAGTGKTVLILNDILRSALDSSRVKIIITFNPYVAFFIRTVLNKILGTNLDEFNIYLYTFREFILEFLAPKLKININLNEFKEAENILSNILERNPDFKQYKNKIEKVKDYIRALFKGNKIGKIKKLDDILNYFSISKKKDLERIKIIFQIYKLYEDKIKEKNINDIYDIYHNIYEKLKKIKKLNNNLFSLYIDEIQDFSNLERNIIFNILPHNNKNKVLITGDINQQISLVGFEWKTVRNNISERFNNIKGNFYFKLNINFRNTLEIIRFSELFIKKDQNLSYISESGYKPQIIIFKKIDKLLKILKKVSSLNNIMFICFNNSLNFNNIFNDDSLYFNYKNAKGLENDIVILIDPFSIIEDRKIKEILFTSISRARKYLYIFSLEKNYKRFLEIFKITNEKRDTFIEKYFEESLIKKLNDINDNIIDDITLRILKISKSLNLYKIKKKNTEINLIKEGAWEHLAIMYESDGTTESYKKLAKLYLEKLQKPNMAAYVYKDYLQNYKEAGKIYEIYIKDYRKAAKIYERGGELFEGLKKYHKSLELYESAIKLYYNYVKKIEKTINLLIRKGDILINNIGDIQEAYKQYRKAINIYQGISKYEAAAELYEKKLNDKRNAKILYKKAVKKYIKLNKYSSAAKLYEKKLFNYKEAIKLYNELNDYESVAKIYEYKLNNIIKAKASYIEAAKYYEKNKQFRKAANIYYLKLNDIDKALENYKRVSDWKMCGNILEKNKKYKLAGDYYLQVALNSSDINVKINNYSKAKDMYKNDEAWVNYGYVILKECNIYNKLSDEKIKEMEQEINENLDKFKKLGKNNTYSLEERYIFYKVIINIYLKTKNQDFNSIIKFYNKNYLILKSIKNKINNIILELVIIMENNKNYVYEEIKKKIENNLNILLDIITKIKNQKKIKEELNERLIKLKNKIFENIKKQKLEKTYYYNNTVIKYLKKFNKIIINNISIEMKEINLSVIEIAKKIKNNKLMVSSYIELGDICGDINYYYSAFNILIKQNDFNSIINLYNNLKNKIDKIYLEKIFNKIYNKIYFKHKKHILLFGNIVKKEGFINLAEKIFKEGKFYNEYAKLLENKSLEEALKYYKVAHNNDKVKELECKIISLKKKIRKLMDEEKYLEAGEIAEKELKDSQLAFNLYLKSTLKK